MGAAKRWKVAAEEIGLPGRPKKTLCDRHLPVSRDFAKDQGLPGWILTPVKWNLRQGGRGPGSTRSNLPAETPPEIRSMSASQRLGEGGIESFGGVGGGWQHDGSPPAFGDERGQHGCIGVANFAGPGGGVDWNEFVTGSEDGDARTDVYIEVRVSAGCSKGDLRGGEFMPAGSCSSPRRACAPFATMFSPLWILRGGIRRMLPKRIFLPRFFDVLQHDNAISPSGNGRACHDLPSQAFGQRAGWRLAGMRGSGDGKCRCALRLQRRGRRIHPGLNAQKQVDHRQLQWGPQGCGRRREQDRRVQLRTGLRDLSNPGGYEVAACS